MTTLYKDNSDMVSRLKRIKASTGSCRRVLRWGQWLPVLKKLNANPSSRSEFLQFLSDAGVSIYFMVENAIWMAQVGILSLSKEQMKKLSWLSDVFYLAEVLPLVPKYVELVACNDDPRKTVPLARSLIQSSFDTGVVLHDLGYGVSAPTRHALGTVTSFIGLYAVYRAARAKVIARRKQA